MNPKMRYIQNFFLLASFLLLIVELKAKVGEKVFSGFMLLENGQEEPKLFFDILGNKNTLINFWSINCIPCKKEIPDLLANLTIDSTTQIYFINTDPETDKEKAIKIAKELKIEKKLLFDFQQVASELLIKPKVLIPTSIIINRKGVIKYESFGYHETTVINLNKAIGKLGN